MIADVRQIEMIEKMMIMKMPFFVWLIILGLIAFFMALPAKPRAIAPKQWIDFPVDQVVRIDVCPLIGNCYDCKTVQHSIAITNDVPTIATIFWKEMHSGLTTIHFKPDGHFSGYGNVRFIYTMRDQTKMAFRMNIGFPDQLITYAWMPAPDANAVYGPPGRFGCRSPTDETRFGASTILYHTLTNLVAIQGVDWVRAGDDTHVKTDSHGVEWLHAE